MNRDARKTAPQTRWAIYLLAYIDRTILLFFSARSQTPLLLSQFRLSVCRPSVTLVLLTQRRRLADRRICDCSVVFYRHCLQDALQNFSYCENEPKWIFSTFLW